ncbi:TetR/AcrR family transcriptional regulator [Amycolatopsis acidicola]|uniref:TetR/AcrR family transcriptional regulator n=1 Tax=Amycolatopsis acidicola TaxID=2596893 RepID=A0A5N0UUM5_9PSEU|nr:TetR/AcrR family transcriptional regulator [Amycolatopsis acidicola]KAA9156344.1 TetR/AcrR family transcriptional regulator [Amycolatopsis acidicola]
MTGASSGTGADTEPRPLPVTARGRRSRQALLDAAKVVFARDGFAEARITDIADTAKVAHGSFYTYFSSKEEIFVALLHELEDELRNPTEASARDEETAGQPHEPYESIRRANLAYLRAYRENHAVMIVWEQVATLNGEVEDLRREASDRFAQRIEDAVRHWQETGVADPAVDPVYAANALTGMVSNFVYRWSARGAEFELEKAAEQLSLLWANAIGVRVPEHRG